MTFSLYALPSDPFALLISILDIKSNYHCSITCTALLKLSENEGCNAAWKAAGEKLGIKELLKGKTWKQTTCILMHRLENPVFTLSYTNAHPIEQTPDLYKFHEKNYCLNNHQPARDSNTIDLELSLDGKLTLQDSKETKELITIDFPEYNTDEVCFRAQDADIHGSLLAITFVESVLVEQDYGDCKYSPATQPSTILQVWNLESKNKIYEHTFDFLAAYPAMSCTQIVLGKILNPEHFHPSTAHQELYVILDLCLTKPAQDRSFMG